MKIIPNDFDKILSQARQLAKMSDIKLLDSRTLDALNQTNKYIESLKISEALTVINSIPSLDHLESFKIIDNAFNKQYFKTISTLYPNTFISRKKDTENYYITNVEKEKVSIPVENVADIVMLNSLVEGIEFNECVEFINYLSDYPMLGYKHTIGNRIFDYIANCQKEKINEIELFRIRISTEQKQIAYTKNEMFEPQFTYPKQNRFSMVGSNPLYLTDNLETALLETGVTSTDKYTYARLKIVNPFFVLNITNDQIPLFRLCHKRAEKNNSNMYVEYLLSNYISDCAKSCSFEGIVYNSVQTIGRKNYVLFSAGKRDFDTIEIKGFNYEKI